MAGRGAGGAGSPGGDRARSRCGTGGSRGGARARFTSGQRSAGADVEHAGGAVARGGGGAANQRRAFIGANRSTMERAAGALQPSLARAPRG